MGKAISVPRLGRPDCSPTLPIGHLAFPTCALIRINYQSQGNLPSKQFRSHGSCVQCLGNGRKRLVEVLKGQIDMSLFLDNVDITSALSYPA